MSTISRPQFDTFELGGIVLLAGALLTWISGTASLMALLQGWGFFQTLQIVIAGVTITSLGAVLLVIGLLR